jgi:hypothetical protein
MSDGLKSLQFKEQNSDFIKFKDGETIKVRIFSTNPVISENTFTNDKTGETTISTKYGFAVWNYNEDRAMILNATPSIAQTIHKLHTDEDYGEDITKLDIKIDPTGEMLERRYAVNVLPKAQELIPAQVNAMKELDEKLDTIIKNGIRADEFNDGKRLKKPDPVIEDINEEEPITLDEIPF